MSVMDEKAKAMLMLGVLNDAFGDIRNMIYYLQDFIYSHPDWAEDFEKLGLNDVLNAARELEKLTLEKMDLLKRIAEGKE
ncbi:MULTISPECIES: cytochrome c biogenesis protein ResB [Archaeoglobus]|nr:MULTISPECIES: cytochrome c biogenesis protein ResB [Archaeoglobus]AIG97978.1 hypothetical protein AFULGI_00011990 [Archaeoglobus fulgidus DSM 8774]KUJ94123.1 MAG: hypothetical protein XD40_0717 [Archaeoglobus fulgidus]KUK07713.1 MAG: Uncharacterized protein XD48_0048 [Archaeoglobus fulgidus]MDI3497409.1 hypothetical protein [Archaeoglobus sp.]